MISSLSIGQNAWQKHTSHFNRRARFDTLLCFDECTFAGNKQTYLQRNAYSLTYKGRI